MQECQDTPFFVSNQPWDHTLIVQPLCASSTESESCLPERVSVWMKWDIKVKGIDFSIQCQTKINKVQMLTGVVSGVMRLTISGGFFKKELVERTLKIA